MTDSDLGERLRRLGLRVSHDQLAAFLAHGHKSRLGPTETLEQLADLEERSRVAVNLARRTRFACLGSFKTLDRFDWEHPEKIDRALVERLLELEFVDRGENVLFKGASGLGKTTIAQNVAQTALAAGFTVRFSTSPPRSPTCWPRSRCPPSSAGFAAIRPRIFSCSTS
jgi:DNA replication protein DnaC